MSTRGRQVTAAARRTLTGCTAFEGPRVTITSQLAPDEWRDVKTVLEKAGAVYVVGTSAFDFDPDQDAETRVKEVLAAGSVMAAAHSDGFVPTPASLAAELVEDDADLWRSPLEPLRVLEPWAGTGRFVEAILAERSVRIHVVAVEPDPRRAARIPADPRVTVVTGTFEEFAASGPGVFDRIVMNPPFSVPGKATLWASHLLTAWELLAPGGRLVAILPKSVLNPSPRGRDVVPAVALIRKHGQAEALNAGTFEESGITFRTASAWMDKPPAGGVGPAPAAAAPYLGRVYPPDWPALPVPRPYLTRGAAEAAPVQVLHDGWRRTDRVFRYVGDCMLCSRPTWAFDDGDNSPLGALGDSSFWPTLCPEPYDRTGPLICLCGLCCSGDDHDKAWAIAERHWSAPAEEIPA